MSDKAKRASKGASNALIFRAPATAKAARQPNSEAALGLGIGALCAMLVAVVSSLGWLRGLEQNAMDALFQLRGPRATKSRIVLMVVDDQTVARVRRAPMPREVYADIVRRLTRAGVKTIAFNVLIDMPSGTKGDDVLAAACRESGRVVQGVTFDAPSLADNGELPERFALKRRGARCRFARSVALPLPALLGGAARIGHLNNHPEPGGQWRRSQHLMNYRGHIYPSLALATVAHYLDLAPSDIVAGRGEITLPASANAPETRRVPVNRSGDTWVNWAGGGTTFPVFSFLQLQDGLVPDALLKDSIVLIGVVAAGSTTPISTPFSTSSIVQTSLDLQANAMDDIVANRALREAPPLWNLALIAILSLAGGVFMATRGAFAAIFGMAVLGAGALVGAVFTLGQHNFYWPIAAPLLSLMLTCAACISQRQVRQARELKIVKDIFGGYVGDEVLDQLRGRLPEMGGEIRVVAVLFCDIRQFTGLSENLRDEPAKLLGLLNAHFEPLVQSLKEHGAYVDNYLGDMVIAVFGAPIEAASPDANARQAVLAALDFVRIVRARNARWQLEGLPPIEVGIGLHTARRLWAISARIRRCITRPSAIRSTWAAASKD